MSLAPLDSPSIVPSFDPPLSSCPLCGGMLRRYDRDFRGITIDCCLRCGVRMMNPQYTDSHLAKLYSIYPTLDDPTDERLRYRRALKSAKLAIVENHVEPGSLLSIGSGDGLEIELAHERGWRVEGYEIDAALAKAVGDRHDVSVRHGPIEEVDWAPESFDCVYVDQVLEHPKNPAAYLRTARRVLRPEGVLMVAVPNIASIASTYKTLAGRLGLKRRRGRHYDTWHHLFYYSPDALAGLLSAQFGFRVLRVFGDPDPPFDSLPRKGLAGLRRLLPALDSSFMLVASPAPV